MTLKDNDIVATYSKLLEGLSANNKIGIIESLAKSLQTSSKIKEDRFYSSFGAWDFDKPAADIVAEIKLSRKFRQKEIKF